jgi:hypothetical protein
VKRPGQTLARSAVAAANIPDCIISWARPVLRRNVDFPPWFAPVIITSDAPSALTSLPITGVPAVSARHGSYRPAAENAAPAGGSGSGKQAGPPVAASRSWAFSAPM